MLLLGGVLGDRINGRSYLSAMHLLMALPPLLIAVVHGCPVGFIIESLLSVGTAARDAEHQIVFRLGFEQP